jgi:hypothetical protein
MRSGLELGSNYSTHRRSIQSSAHGHWSGVIDCRARSRLDVTCTQISSSVIATRSVCDVRICATVANRACTCLSLKTAAALVAVAATHGRLFIHCPKPHSSKSIIVSAFARKSRNARQCTVDASSRVGAQYVHARETNHIDVREQVEGDGGSLVSRNSGILSDGHLPQALPRQPSVWVT